MFFFYSNKIGKQIRLFIQRDKVSSLGLEGTVASCHHWGVVACSGDPDNKLQD